MGGRYALGIALALLAFPLTGVAEAKERADRSTLQRRLGNQGVVDLDRRTGTPRVLARLDGTLTGRSSRSPESIASSYVRSNLSVLGLTTEDVSATPVVEALPGGVESVTWRQYVDGIPASDRSLRVNVGADGRILSVLGSPEHDLDVATTPSLDAGEALRAVQDDVGVYRSLVRKGAPSGAQRTTDYGDDTAASLVTASDRLAWRVTYRASADAVYDATVDARTGVVLRVVNMVKSDAPATVWERFPGSGAGGTATTVDLQANGWLGAGATTLDGPNAHTYSDLNDDDVASASEEVAPVGGSFAFPLASVAGTGCDAAHLCSWSGTADRTSNRAQDAVQAFYFANRFHDHLAASPIGFTAAKGAFEGTDDLLLETMDGASTGPNSAHLNNANMFTPPDGTHPRMQMYLWSSPFRRVSSGSDAAILYHEYTHGLSNRLVKDADGYGALNSAQAGAMGEAWSDWYAQDFIVDQFPTLDTGAVGEVTMGAYTDLPGSTSKIRYSPLDCPVNAADPIACPGRPVLGTGGFSYGDFGRVAGGAEVHADGEIWAQTLWDLRSAVGSAKARALVTTGMSLLPPEPSFLDGRNGILLADQTLFAGADAAAIWGVFAGRGMGFFAAATSGDDTAPAENFALPPAAGGPRGTISGQVTNALGGAGVAGVTVGLAGGLSSLSAVTGADGRYTIADVPEGTYLKVMAAGGGWDSAVTSLSVNGGTTITYSPAVKRDWAASKGGATITATNGSEYVAYGCGPNAALDQSQSLGWSTASGTDKYLTIQFPEKIDISQFGIDPTETCGDTASDATGSYRVETSTDGAQWTTARAGTFTAANRKTLNLVDPAVGAAGVRYVRLTLQSSQGAGSFRDLSEFAVYGSPTVVVVPETTLAPGGPPFVFTSSVPTSTFECKLDDGAFAACTSPFTPGVLSDGDHTFSVRAVGDQTPETRTFTVDTTAPETTIDSGPSPFVFSSSEAGSTFECKVDDGDFAACTSPDARTFADGPHTFAVRAKDAAGNVDATPASKTFTVDTTAPETTIDSGPSPFVFSSNEAGSTFECKVDDGDFVACTSPDARTFADGPHTFAVRAKDAAGNVDATPATKTFTVDTTAPETMIDSGPSPFVFSSSEVGSTFECKVDDGDFVACTSPDARTFADGPHTFAVRAKDAAGNVDATPATKTFTVDTTAPETMIDSGPSPFVFSSSEVGSTFECKVDDGDFAACTSPDARTFADGPHTFAVRAKDAAGNVDATPATKTFTVDTTAPDTTIDSGPSPFVFSSSEAGSTFECKVDDGEFAACTSPDARTFTDGPHTFSVRAKDAAGNVDATPATKTFTVDTTAPDTTIDSGPSPFVFSSSEVGSTFECKVDDGDFAACTSPDARTFADGPHTFSVRAKDAAGNVDATPATKTFTVDTTAPDTTIDSGPKPFRFSSNDPTATFECKVDDGDFVACTSPIDLVTVGDGTYTFSVRAKDAAGNVDPTPATRTFTIDTVAPETTIDAGPSAFVFSSSEANSTFECKVDDGDFAACTSPDARTFTDGTHTFAVRAKDAAGNVDATPATKTFSVDTTPPDTTIDSGATGTTRDTTPQFSFSASEAGSTFECSLNGAAFATCVSPRELGPLADGDYTFRVRAKDAAGNVDPTAATRTFTVDTTPPDTTIEAGGPPFRFSATEVGSTFECKVDAGAYAPCTSPITPAAVTDGDHILFVRATDPSGNADQTPATRTFTVDTTAPETTIESGPSPFRFSSNEPGSTFECSVDGGPFVTCTSPRDVGTLSEATHTFDVRATDAFGNTDQTPARQTFVVDRTGPAVTSLTGPPNRSNDTTPTFAFATNEPGDTFECKLTSPDHPGTFAACTSPKTYAALTDDARYTFTVRATDAAGNTGAEQSLSYTLYTTAPETGITSGPRANTNDANPVFVVASSPPGAAFACTLDGAPVAPCTSPVDLAKLLHQDRLAEGPHVFTAAAKDDAGNVDATPVSSTFTIDTIAPVPFVTGPTAPVHSGPLAFSVGADQQATVACALDDHEYGSCGIVQADTLAAGEHVFHVRAEDAAGNISVPIAYSFTIVNAAPTAALVFDTRLGVAPFTTQPTIFGADDDADRLTYALDFGDGQIASGTLPVVLVGHRYESPGVYAVTLTVTDGRESATVHDEVTVTSPQPDLPPPTPATPLSLSLSAANVSLGTFIPGLARDYAASLTATTTGNGTLTVSDLSGTAPGHLVGPSGALAQPLQVRSTSGALTPLTSAVTIPATVELVQAITPTETLKPGAYTKALTFTLSVTSP